MQLSIIQEPDSRLHEVSLEVPFDKYLSFAVRTSIEDLRDTFHAANDCIGLAAPQLGIPLRIIIVDVTDRHSDTYLMINPVITQESEEQQRVQDGCMSVGLGKIHLPTRRPKRIKVSWTDSDGERWQQKFSGTIAACIHHEIDHLNGKLFMERADAVL